MLPPFDLWQPYAVSEIEEKFQAIDWILAGGSALQLFVGASYRNHSDIDILVERSVQTKFVEYIPLQNLFVALQPGKLTPYNFQRYYEQPIQDIWYLHTSQKAWALQIMLFDVVDNHWIYKRNPAISLPLDDIYFEKNNIKVLRPEIQLLYKSQNIRPKDQLDFERVISLLDRQAKSWLKNALEVCYEESHVWENDLIST